MWKTLLPLNDEADEKNNSNNLEGTLTHGVSQSASLKPESQGVENEASLVQKESKVTA